MARAGVNLAMGDLDVRQRHAQTTVEPLGGVTTGRANATPSFRATIALLMKRHMCLSNVHLIVCTAAWASVRNTSTAGAWGHRVNAT